MSQQRGENVGSTGERLKLIGSTTVHLYGLPGKQQADVPMEGHFPRLELCNPAKIGSMGGGG